MKRDYRELRQLANVFHDRFSELNYDTSMSLTQKFNILLEYFKNIAKDWEEVLAYLKEFEEKFDEKLYKTVEDILVEWLEDGTMADIIAELVVKQGDLSIFRPFDPTVMEKMKNEFNEHFFNIKWFGAIGDGIANDAPAIRLAIKEAEKNGGTVYFPEPEVAWKVSCAEENTEEGRFAFVINNKNIILRGYSGKYYTKGILVDSNCNLTSLFKLNGNLEGLEVYNMYFDLNKQSEHGFMTVGGYLSNGTFKNVQIARPLISGVKLATYMTTFESVYVNFSSKDGFWIIAPDGNGVNTSLTFTSCYANTSSATDGVGFRGNILTYCNFISCGVDHYTIGYHLTNAYSVSINGCGAENVSQMLYARGYLGLNILGLYGLYNGGSETTDLMEFSNGNSATISGFVNREPKTYRYVLNLTSNANSTENITVLDNSINENEINYVTNWKYLEPIVLNRGTLRADFFDRTVNVTPANFQTELYKLRDRVIHANVTLNISEGEEAFREFGSLLRNISGRGSITIKGATSDATKTILSQGLRFQNVRVPIIIKDITIKSGMSSGFNVLSSVDNVHNIRYQNVIFDANNKNNGAMIDAKNNSNVSLGIDVINKNDYFTSTNMKILNTDSSSKIFYDKSDSLPASKYFDVGQRIYYKTNTDFEGRIFKNTDGVGGWSNFGSTV